MREGFLAKFGEFVFRNCPKSLGRARSVARRAAKGGFSVYFTLRIPAKSTIGALLEPLFGQFLEGRFSEVQGVSGQLGLSSGGGGAPRGRRCAA
jgi:hypothetical protein